MIYRDIFRYHKTASKDVNDHRKFYATFSGFNSYVYAYTMILFTELLITKKMMGTSKYSTSHHHHHQVIHIVVHLVNLFQIVVVVEDQY